MLIPAAALVLTLSFTPQGSTQAASSAAPAQPSPLVEELWDAARAGDVARVAKALDAGADVNAGNRYKATALFFAADKGRVDVIRLLLDRGADINAQDTFYRFRPIGMALMNGHVDAALLLLQRGSLGGFDVLTTGIREKQQALIDAGLASKELTAANLRNALALAKKVGTPEIVAALEKKAASLPPEAAPAVKIDPATLKSYAGNYRNESAGAAFTVSLAGDQLTLVTAPGNPPLSLVPASENSFTISEAPNVTVTFAGRGGVVERLLVQQPNGTQAFERVAASAASSAPSTSTGAPASSAPPSTSSAPAAPPKDPVRAAPKPWPSFRGGNASGNGDGQGAVAEWDVDTKQNVRWKTPIPGFSTGSPIVWGDKVFVVTAISSKGDKTFRTGLYGDVKPVEDLSEHTWKMYCLDRASGRILWEETAFTGLPKVKRHTKSTQANSTPVTDGNVVVAVFGSIGLLEAWDVNGKPLWKQEIGVIDNGWFFDPTYQWGHSSSPIIHDGKVILVADGQKNSYIAAYDVKTGKQLWKTDRDEISTWGTPTVFTGDGRTHIVTNGTTIRAYDPATGKLTWKLGPNSEVTVGTPVVGDGLVFITAGYPPVRPIYAVKPTASGDITMPKDATSSDAVAWSNTSGTYIPTPLYYEGILYTLNNDGILTAYDAKTGTRHYRARVGGGGSFSASPIAADGKLFFANEDGDIIVARAGTKYEEIGKNEMKEVIMSTPAISDGTIIVRTLGHVYAIGQKE